MSSHVPALPQLHTTFKRSPSTGDSSSDTPGGNSRTNSGHFVYGTDGLRRSSIGGGYSSATDVDIGYSSAASNTTYIPPYHLQQQYSSPPQGIGYQAQPISPQNQVNTSPELSNNRLKTAQSSPVPSAAAQQPSTAAQYRRAPPSTPPVPLACTECRLRHLKCDAGAPTCGRCRAEGRDCRYVKSRRGWKGRKRKGTTSNSGQVSATSGTEATSADERGDPGSYSGIPRLPNHYTIPASATKQQSPPLTNPLDTLRAFHKHSTTFPGQHEHPPHAPTASLIQLYYAYFHSSHPFLLPPTYLVKTQAAKLQHLLPVVRYIGSFFAPNAPRDSFRDAAEYTLFRQNAPRNGFTVQAMLLFAIGLHAANEQEKSAQVKDVAVDIAIEIGMNREEFAYFGGEKIPDDVGIKMENGDASDGLDEKRNSSNPTERVMQESWRRTWWELYFLDCMLAGVHQNSEGFRLWMVECTVPLPCGEHEYNNGRIPEPKSLQDFDDRTFLEESVEFSSYAYRVEAVRILGTVLAMARDGGDDARADAADASLVNWAIHLPDDKKELVGKDRKVDEMLFQAHMVVYATSIYLHRPRSQLVFSLVPDDTTCTPSTSYVQSPHPVLFHTSKTLHAANAISKLVTLPTPLIKHSPFFTCILTLATVVHLSAASWFLSGDEAYLAKERIRLGIGALKTLEEVWNIAGAVLQQVKVAAKEVFRWQRPDGWAELIGQGGAFTEEEMMRYIEEERALEGDVAEGTRGGIVGGVAGHMMMMGGMGDMGIMVGIDGIGEEEVEVEAVREEVLHGVPGLDWDGS